MAERTDEGTVRGFDLAGRVRAMTQQYVYRRAEARSGITYESFRNARTTDPVTGRTRVDEPQRYRDAREKVCGEAFYALRACRSQEEFVAYFTGTLCSVPQALRGDDFHGLAEALLGTADTWEDARALAMLTVSSLW